MGIYTPGHLLGHSAYPAWSVQDLALFPFNFARGGWCAKIQKIRHFRPAWVCLWKHLLSP